MYPMDGQGGNFGQSVAIGENVVFIGADKSKIGEESVGAVYVFVPIGQFWTQEERLLTSDGRISDSVGFSIDLDGDSLIVGAPRHNAGGVSSGAAYVFQAGEEGWTQRGKLFDDDTAIEDRFGAAVAISGGTAIVGSSRDDDAGTNAGAVYIFVRQSREWPLQAKLNSDDARPGDLFGDAVAISGEIALVGASGADAAGPESGAAYIFVRRGDTWSQQAKLIGNDTAALDRFGAAVFIEGDTAIVGAHGSDTTGTDAGAAYVFVNTGGAWTQQAKLTATDAVPGDLFGFSVGLSGDSAVVGAYRATAAGPDSGAAYIFTRVGTQWRQSAKLSPKDADVGDLFGYTVAINGDTALIGAPKDDHVGVDAGSAYIFVRSETAWLEQEKLTATDAEMEDEFGIAVSLSRDRALIGAWKDNHPPLEDSDDPADHIDKGSVYAFLRSGFSWRQEARTFAPGATAFDQFGVSVSISGNFSAIGSHGNDTNGNNAGAAYIFDAQSLRFIPDDVPFAVDPTGLQLTTFGRVKETAAFQNYPNPFNPETWIPYYLAKPTSVEIIIYNAAGHQVRRLDLGFKPTGEYIAHAKAAYWDGRSDTGELVSSGVYFYRFRAGDYSATRKMIVLK